ncbi:MAG: hypothetical protein R3B48_14475 [Kofleriaceae bacterium]
MDRAFESQWMCGGHPALVLPYLLDGVELTETTNYAELVARTLIDPPFVAPGFKGTAFWVTRLYRVMPSGVLQAKIGEAVATHLWSDNAVAVRAALDFYIRNAAAAGAEQLVQVGERDRDRLTGLADPEDATGSIYEHLFDALDQRLIVHGLGMVDDPSAVAFAKAALLRGDVSDMTIYQVAEADPVWFADHAVQVATVRKDNLEYAVAALSYVPQDRRDDTIAALRMISQRAEREVRNWARDEGVRLPKRPANLPS